MLTSIPEVELERSVAEYSSISGGWAWDRLDNLLAQDTKENIVASPCPKSNAGRDLVAWSLTNDGEFSSKFAYNSLGETSSQSSSLVLKEITKWRGLERV